MGRICEKATACRGSDPALEQACSAMAAVPKMSIPQGCAAAQECLDKIDHIDVCGSMANNLDPMALMQATSSCVTAMQSC